MREHDANSLSLPLGGEGQRSQDATAQKQRAIADNFNEFVREFERCRAQNRSMFGVNYGTMRQKRGAVS